MEWVAPFGALSAANWLAMPAQRYMHDFGLRREHLGVIAINARRNAALNPDAIYRDPLSMQDYLNARMISEPLCLYDCDVPCDGATAVVISRREATSGLPRHPLTIESVGPACTNARPGTSAGTLRRWPPTTPERRCGNTPR
ncbi:putative diterpenoid dioxygenase [Mycobacterium xenopi 3993]|nr:putative diterpenoid dioxygenase [Mycobacterium xenopi 3993]